MLALIETAAFARACGRPFVALSVDHGLQQDSAAWSALAAERAVALGGEARILTWRRRPEDRTSPSAARAARHALLAEAARAAGAAVIVTGHTADDNLENRLLGQGALGEWAPSPAWPQGRGVFLLRPLLGLRRAEVRARLEALGARFIDDPANADERHPRVRARLAIAGGATANEAAPRAPSELAAQSRFGGGALRLSRAAFRAADADSRRRWTAVAATCLGGGAAPPRGARAHRLAEALAGDAPVNATLAGARIAAGEAIVVCREAGDISRRGTAAGDVLVWDGRYAFEKPPGAVAPAAGLRARLSPADHRALKRLEPAARGAAPVRIGALRPILATHGPEAAEWLVPARFAAACGAISHETEV